MPDHLHVQMVFEHPNVQVRASIERIKQLTAFAYTRRTNQRLWQRSYFDGPLRSDDCFESTVAYIVNNPLRAGFVALPDSWPFWGSSRWSRRDLLETIAAAGPGCRPG
jgi:REP element-mobilizing transposase RayT